jgi:hypothetical protein
MFTAAANLCLMDFNIYFIIKTSVDTEMCCPKGKCGCQYYILLTLEEKKNHEHRVLDFFK